MSGFGRGLLKKLLLLIIYHLSNPVTEVAKPLSISHSGNVLCMTM